MLPVPFAPMYGFQPHPPPFPAMMSYPHPPPPHHQLQMYEAEQPAEEQEEHSEAEEVEEAVEEKKSKPKQGYIIVSGDIGRIDPEDQTGEGGEEVILNEDKPEVKIEVKEETPTPTRTAAPAIKVPKSTSDPEYKRLIDNLETLRAKAPPYTATRPKPLIVVRGNGEIVFSPSQNRLKSVAGFSEGQVKQISTNLRKPYEVHKIDVYGTDSVETIQVISLPIGTKR